MFSRSVTIVLGLCYVVCTLLQITGFATPAWVVSDYNGEIYESNGLWYCITCRDGGECEAKTYQEIHKEYKTAEGDMVYADQVREIVIATLSVASSMFACVLLLINICVKYQRPVLSLISILFTFISASLLWTIIASTLVPIAIEQTKTYGFPYSLFLSALGSFGSLVLAIIYLVKLLQVMNSLSPTYQPL